MNIFSYKLLAVIMFERPDYSRVRWLENAGAVWGKNTTFTFFKKLVSWG
jgi:hypothetical protein